MKSRFAFFSASLLAAAVFGTIQAATAQVPNCPVLSPVGAGTYSSGCLDPINGYFLNGRPFSGIDCEQRGFLIFNVPSSATPFVAAELRLPLLAVFTPDGTETFELREVTTPLTTLTNLSGSRPNIFADLGDGAVFGSHAFSPQDFAPGGNLPETPVPVRLTPAGLAALNAARGRPVVFGGTLARVDSPLRVDERIHFSQQLSSFTLALQPSNAAPPQVTIETTQPQRQAGGILALTGVACGGRPLALQWLRNGIAIPAATNSVIVASPALPSDSGRYVLRASNAFGLVHSAPVDIEVVPLTLFNPPIDVTAFEGDNTCLSVGASSLLPLRFEWRKNGATLLQSLNPNLCFTPLTFSDAGRYDVIVSNDYGSVTSRVVLVTVNQRPPFIAYFFPAPLVHAPAGLPLELSSLATGTAPITYQWLKNGRSIPGATSNNLSFATVVSADMGDYQLIASNAVGVVTSIVGRVEVVPAILHGPNTLSVDLGNRATLFSFPQAIPETTFQWYRNGVRIPGETNFVWIRREVALADQGQYFMVASNRYGTVTSSVADLIVQASRPVVYVTASDGLPASEGSYLILSAATAGGPPPSLQWYKDGLGLSGQTNAHLVFERIRTNDMGQYWVVASNRLSSVTSIAVRVDVELHAPRWGLVPQNTNEVMGSIVTMQAFAYGGPPPTYQWRHRGADLPGATNATLVLPRVTAAEAGPYEVVARNSVGEVRYTHDLHLRPDTSLDHWNWRRPHSQGSRLRDIVWGDGRFVAVGKAGNIITSTDGTNWVNSLIEADCDLSSVTYGAGRFIAAGVMRSPAINALGGQNGMASGLVLVSTNGTTWEPVHGPNGYVYDLSFGNGTFVLTTWYDFPDVDGAIFAYTSTNGLDWEPRQVPGGKARRVTFLNGEFWTGSGYELYRSLNGRDWRVAARSLLSENFDLFTYGDGLYVALGQSGLIGQFSSDGENWTGFYQPQLRFQSVAHGNGRFVATLAFPYGAIATSENGRRWTQRETGTRQEMESVIFVNGRFWAVGEAGAIITSTDGISWSPDLVANRIDYYGLTRFGDLVIAAGDDGTILTTIDGETWTQRPTPSGRNLHCVQHGDGLVIAGGRGGRLMTSPDGINWTTRASGTTNYIERLAWAGRWVGVCEGGDIITSTNGINWSRSQTLPVTDHEGVAYGEGYWMAVGGYFPGGGSGNAVGTIYLSTNGQHWGFSLNHLNHGKRFRDVAYGQGRFVLVGNDGLVSVLAPTGEPSNPMAIRAFYFISTIDGTGRQFENLRRIYYAQGRFVIAGNNGALFSSSNPDDGTSWIEHRSRTSQNLHDIVAAADGTYYAVGNNGMILQSGMPSFHFTHVRHTGNSVVLEFNPINAMGPLRLEESSDLRTWQLTADPATTPVEVPATRSGARYFRLRTR